MIKSTASNSFVLCIAITLAAIFGFSTINQAHAKPNPKYASFVMDAETGQILHQSNATKKLHPASLTKVMTLLLAFEAIENGQVNYNTRIRMSKHAASMVPSKLDLPAGSSIRMKDAIYALVTKSANDVAVAIAEELGGSEYRFARLMNKKAREIGMTSTNFKNASGLHHESQVTTARDMAKMANYVIQKYPSYYRFFATQSFTYRGKTYRNHNRLMQTYEGMDGMKTGYINASGFNLIASAKRKNRRIIGVVFGGRTSQSRNSHMADLLDRAFKVPQSKTKTHLVADLAPPPVPDRKPGFAVAMNTIQKNVTDQTGVVAKIKKATPEYRWVSLEDNKLIGQGDADPDVYDRIRAQRIQTASLHQDNIPNWSIQVGAFSSRAKTDRVLHAARKQLPDRYASAKPSIAPLKTKNGWLFRARLSGYTKAEANKACSYIENCMTVAPVN